MSTIKGTISSPDATVQHITGRIGTPSVMSAGVNYGQPANPSNNHTMMLNRDARDQHPIKSISGLEEILGQIDERLMSIIDDWSMDDSGYLYLRANGENVIGPIGPFTTSSSGTGPGGGSSYAYTISILNLLTSRVLTVAEGERVVLKFNYSSVDDENMDDGPGLGQILVGGVVRLPFSANQGPNEIDVTEFLASGTNNVTVRITNSENSSKPLTYTITIASVSLASSFDASIPYSGSIFFPYVPTGIAEKTMHFELDGKEIGTAIVTSSGRQQSYTIPPQSHGSHVLRVWFTCTVNNVTVPSNVLYYSIICTVTGNTTPIIAVTSPPLSGVEQNSNIVKKYRVYSPMSLTSEITLEVDDEVVANLNVDRTEQTWTYRADKVGVITQTIRCGDVSISWTQSVTEGTIKVEAETEALALYLTSYGRSNEEANPGVWENNGYQAEFVGFNFVSDGWVTDEEDNNVLRLLGDARLNIPYKMFADDFRTTGKTLEFELATRDVIDYDAEVLTCWSGDRGFKVTARQLLLVSEQSELNSLYKENEHIRVTFVAQKRSEYRLLLCYINGIMSGAVQYPENDDFSQAVPVGISVGSNKCTIDLYTIRAYDNSLTRYQVLDNWIADTRSIAERQDRFKRNDVYDEYGRVVIEKLPQSLCYLVVSCNQLPQFKGDKKTCSGYFVDLVHPDRSFNFANAEIDVQGTSSQFYWRKNYKIKFKGGFILHDGSTVSVYAMNENAVPVSTFTMKADVASSEGAYNVVSAKLYNDLCPYTTPAQEADPKTRHSIDGFPMVIFWDGPDGVQFLGKYNFNNDKGVPESFGLKSGDERWEVLENGNDLVGFHSADFVNNDWTKSFEGNFPDGNTNTTKLQQMCAWVNSTKGNPEKFAAELDQWFVPEMVDYYYLFTELLLCMDQREKNVLWRYDASLQRWWADYYDADSTFGYNNQGKPTFDYYMEDTDYLPSGDPVYNGQNSVFWNNVRLTRHENIKQLYQDLRSTGALSYDVVYNAIATHQANWPEAIFNEDMQVKCIDALIEEGDGTYLPFLWGKKELWTKQWLYNRFGYLDSKYETGDSMTNRMTIRTNKMEDITMTSYVNMYGHVYYNAEHIPIRMERNVPYTFESQATGAEDRVIGINDANKITSLGDLAPHDVELIDLSACKMLTEIKLGDKASDYVNYSLTSATFGENTLLRKVDLRNCVAYAQVPDLSRCVNIEEVYAEGSAITGISLPNGGALKTLHLPNTVVSLQVVNQPKLNDFIIPSYGQITTLRLENAGVLDSKALDILEAIPENSRVRVLGFSKEMTNDELFSFITRLDAMRGLDENGNNVDRAQVSGTIYLDEITPVEYAVIADAQARYPSLIVMYNKFVPYVVRFYNYDGTLLQTVNVEAHGAAAVYTGDTPVRPNASDAEDWQFIGWHPDPVSVTGNMDCYAQFKNMVSKSRLLIMRTLSGDYVNDRVTSVGSYAFGHLSKLTSISLPSVTTIENFAFCRSGVKSVYLRSVQSIGRGSLQQTTSLETLVLGNTETVCALLTTDVLTQSKIAAGTGYVYVPAALVDSYKSATNWAKYANQIRAIEDYPEICGGEV